MYNIDIVKIRQSEVNTMVNEKYYEGYEGDEEILFRLCIDKEEVESVGIWAVTFPQLSN